ncbi:MAG: hypothetical protein EOM93_05610 [Gammaproteobacteria bacterium]|nr:hypothetical protein [Gammaproteobacteria bacterium]
MAFSTCKYDRELQFIWSKMENLRGQLASLDAIDGDEEEKKLVADRRENIENEIKMLSGRKEEIEGSYLENDMEEYLETMRLRRNAPDTVWPTDISRSDARAAPMSEIESITREISELEVRLINAELDGDGSESAKITMSLSALRSRRSDLIEDLKSERARGDAPSDGEMGELKKDVSSLRAQVSSLRGDIMEINGFLRRIADKLDLSDGDRDD